MFGRDLRDLCVGGRVVRWHRQRYTRMGYSYLPVGCPAALRDWLAEPLPPTLFFAGEATNRQQPSTVHGALESGVRAAQQVLEARERVRASSRLPATWLSLALPSTSCICSTIG